MPPMKEPIIAPTITQTKRNTPSDCELRGGPKGEAGCDDATAPIMKKSKSMATPEMTPMVFTVVPHHLQNARRDRDLSNGQQ